jgi:predicted nucleic acid-binding protein
MLDTNLLISMFIFPNDFMNRIKKVLCSDHQILLCTYVVDELKEVVARKSPARSADIDWFLQSFPYTLVYTPEQFDAEEYPKIRDIADLPVLVSAILEDADILITSDKDFTDVEIEKPEILKPHDFMAIYG